MTYGPLPGVRLTWDAYADVDPFSSYTLYRRPQRSILDARETVAMVVIGAQTWIQVADLFDAVQGGFSMRGSMPAGGTGVLVITSLRDDADNYLELVYDEPSQSFEYTRAVAGVTATATFPFVFTADVPWTATVYQTAAGIGLSVNGGTFVTASLAGAELAYAFMEIGARSGFLPSDVDVNWLVTFAGVLVQSDAVTLAAFDDDEFGDYPPSFEPLRDLDADTVPVGLWANLEDNAYKVTIADWIAIASIDDVDRTYYSDRRTWSRQVYEYTLTVTALVSADLIESARQMPPVLGTVTFLGTAIHNVADETTYVRPSVAVTRVVPEQERAYLQARGRQTDTLQLGERQDSLIHIEPVIQSQDDRVLWQTTLALFTAQRETGAIFQVRPGHQPEGYFVNMDGIARADVTVMTNVGIDLHEVFFDENA